MTAEHRMTVNPVPVSDRTPSGTQRLTEYAFQTFFLSGGDDAVTAFLKGRIPPVVQDKDSQSQTNFSLDSPTFDTAVRRLASQIDLRNRALGEITISLQRFHDPQQSLRVLAAKDAILSALNLSGNERVLNFRDASQLIQPVVENAISGRDYALIFLFGWLQWQIGDQTSAAEEAFSRAAQLSSSSSATPNSPYLELSLRHIAFMQYLRRDFAAASETMSLALRFSPKNVELRYDAARYAARVGDREAALAHLIFCLDDSPLFARWMPWEEDFSAAGIDAAALTFDRTAEACRQSAYAIDAWRSALGVAQTIQQQYACPIRLPEEIDRPTLDAFDSRLAQTAGTSELLEAVALRESSANKAEEVLDVLRAALQSEERKAEIEAKRFQDQAERLVSEVQLWTNTRNYLESTAENQGYSLHTDTGLGWALFPAQASRKKRIKTARVSYALCLMNQAEAEEALKGHLGPVQAAVAAAKKRSELLHEVYAGLAKEADPALT